MRRCLVWALLALLLSSGASFASLGQGGFINQTSLVFTIFRNPDTVNGTLSYQNFVGLVPDEWRPDIVYDVPNLGSAVVDNGGAPLPHENIEIGYRDKLGNYVLLGTTTTDSEGKFGFPLNPGAGGVDFTGVVQGRCTNVTANFTGTPSNAGFVREMLYCEFFDYGFIFNNVNFMSCIPIFIIFGILAAAMYASGGDPLRAFDISTPRLPTPKYKPVMSEVRFFPGWKNQRTMQAWALKDTERGIQVKLAELENRMNALSAQGGRMPTYGINALLKNYKGNSQFISALRNARDLTWAQRSLLAELLYLGAGDKRFLAVAGVTKKQLTNALANGGDRQALKGISRNMDARITNREAGDVKASMKKLIAKYEAESKTLTQTQKDGNINAVKALESLSWLTGSADPTKGGAWAFKPGIRENNEQARIAFDVGRRWAGLGSYKMLTMKPGEKAGAIRTFGDKVGAFIAKTPGLRGEFATAITSARLVTRIHKNVATGMIGAIAAPVARGLGVGVKTTEKMARTEGRVGTAGNGFEGMSLEIRAAVAQLRRDGRINDIQKREILSKTTALYRRAQAISGGKDPDDVKIRELKKIQKEYMGIIEIDLGPYLSSSVEGQLQSERLGKRYAELLDVLNSKFAERIRRGDPDISKSKLRQLEEEVGVKKKAWEERKTMDDAVAFAGAVEVYTRARHAGIKQSVDWMQGTAKALGKSAVAKGTRDLAVKEIDGQMGMLTDAHEALKVSGALEDRRYSRLTNLVIRRKEDFEGLNKTLTQRMDRDLPPEKNKPGGLLPKSEDTHEKQDEAQGGKKGGPKSQTDDAFDFLVEEGYISRQSATAIDKWLDLEKNKGKVLLTREETMELKKFAEDLANLDRPVMWQRRTRTGTIFEYTKRRKIEERFEELLKKGDETGARLLVRRAAWARDDNDPEVANHNIQRDFYATYAKNAIKLEDKDRIRISELNERLDECFRGPGEISDKARRLTDLAVTSMPWFRKKQQEYAETLVRALESDSRSAIRSYGSAGVEDTNYLAVNMRDTNRKLMGWAAANEEILERGFIPGGQITHDKALKGGAWIQRPEAYWVPATSKDPERMSKLKTYVQNNLAGADRVLYGHLSEDGTIQDNARNISPVWERAILSGIWDMGFQSLRVRGNITQLWQTLDYTRGRYANQELFDTQGRPFTLDGYQTEYMKNKLGIRKEQSDLDFQIFELKQKREKADEAERNKIDQEIKVAKENAEVEIKRMKRELREQKAFMHAMGYEPTIADMWNRVVHGSGTDEESFWKRFGSTIKTGYRSPRNVFGSNIDPDYYDPEMARLSRQYALESYGTMFMGIIGVRSGRAMSSLYDSQGYIATGQALWGNAVMEPRRNNWVEMEWSELDVAWASSPGARWQNRIPGLRHLTYGNFVRALATPAIMANQPIAAAMRYSNTAAEGMPGQWEPQYEYRPDWWRGFTGGALGIMTFSPFPGLKTLAYAATNLNPARDGWFARLGVGRNLVPGVASASDLKYDLYKFYNKLGGTNYALEGKTDTEGFSGGGPILRMGNIDQYYMADYAGGYQPMFFKSPFLKNRTFPAWVSNVGANAPGLVGSHFDLANPEIFRRETTAREHFMNRAPYEKLDQYGNAQGGTAKSTLNQLWNLTAPGWTANKIKHASGRLSSLSKKLVGSEVHDQAILREQEKQRQQNERYWAEQNEKNASRYTKVERHFVRKKKGNE